MKVLLHTQSNLDPMRSIKISAPGKLHLLGEHSVVYGKPAMIVAVNKRCFVELVPNHKDVIQIVLDSYNEAIQVSSKNIFEKR